MPEIKHATLRFRGSKDIYVEDANFNETSTAKIRQFVGADAIEKSKVTPKATVDFTCGIPTSGAIQYRLNLRRGDEVNLTWDGADNVKHEMWGIVQTANETDPKEGEHRLSVTLETCIITPR